MTVVSHALARRAVDRRPRTEGGRVTSGRAGASARPAGAARRPRCAVALPDRRRGADRPGGALVGLAVPAHLPADDPLPAPPGSASASPSSPLAQLARLRFRTAAGMVSITWGEAALVVGLYLVPAGWLPGRRARSAPAPAWTALSLAADRRPPLETGPHRRLADRRHRARRRGRHARSARRCWPLRTPELALGAGRRRGDLPAHHRLARRGHPGPAARRAGRPGAARRAARQAAHVRRQRAGRPGRGGAAGARRRAGCCCSRRCSGCSSRPTGTGCAPTRSGAPGGRSPRPPPRSTSSTSGAWPTAAVTGALALFGAELVDVDVARGDGRRRRYRGDRRASVRDREAGRPRRRRRTTHELVRPLVVGDVQVGQMRVRFPAPAPPERPGTGRAGRVSATRWPRPCTTRPPTASCGWSAPARRTRRCTTR